MSLEKGIFVAAEYASAAIPDKPKLAPWIVLVDLGDGRIQLRGALTRFILPHAFFSDAFKAIQPYLDGSREIDAIKNVGGVDPTAADFVMRMLASNGLLLPGDLSVECSSESFRFLGQVSNRAAYLPEVLKTKLVWLVGDDGIDATLAPMLTRVGISRLEVIDGKTPDLPDRCNELLDRGVGQPDLIVATTRRFSDGLFNTLNDYCQSKGIRWLTAVLNGPQARIGPTFIPHQTACYTCLKARLNSNSDDDVADRAFDLQLKTQDEPSQGELDPFTLAIAGQLALETIRLLAGTSEPTTIGRLYRFDAYTPETEAHNVLRVPRCESCSKTATLRRPWDTQLTHGIPS